MKALDLFCGAGGATRGLQLAGYHVSDLSEARTLIRGLTTCPCKSCKTSWERGGCYWTWARHLQLRALPDTKRIADAWELRCESDDYGDIDDKEWRRAWLRE